VTAFEPVRRLAVHRVFATGERRRVGELAQNRRGAYFQYDEDYRRSCPSLSPFLLRFDGSLQPGPPAPHEGLHGVFADSLPDGWGRLLMDRVCRRHGVLPSELTPMDRLSYVGDRGLGALEYTPQSPFAPQSPTKVDLLQLGERARELFEDESADIGPALAATGTSGGARPKALVYLPSTGASRASTQPGDGLEPWLVKFTSASLPLGHEESLCEAAYLSLAADAGIDTPQWRLIPASARSPAIASLALRRFDCTADGGRLHMLSLCGLLDADFRAPSMDYEELIKASQVLCDSPAVGQSQFVRAVFNLFAVNQDDHTRNWAFLQRDDGRWRPSPSYDVTFSPSPYGEHATAFVGHGATPRLKDMQRLAMHANYATWARAREVVEEVVDVLQRWPTVAAELGVRRDTLRLIGRRLDAVRVANRGLLGR